MNGLLLAAFFALSPQTVTKDPVPTLSQVTVDVSPNPSRLLTRLLREDFDVLHAQPGGDAYDVLCDKEDLERLQELELSFQVVHQDLARFYEERLKESVEEGTPTLGAWLSPPFGQGSMGGYYTFTEVGSVLDQIASAYPSIVTPKASIGTTHQGRSMWTVKLSDNPGTDENEPEVRFDAMHHAREPESMQATLWTLLFLVENYGTNALATSIVDHREIWFLPVVNPDGYVRNQQTNPGGGGMWRKNRRDNLNGTFGVDLNRNYPFQWGVDNVGSSGAKSSDTYRGPSPASEPETAAMVNFLSTRNFVTALSVHTYSDVWLYPWGYVATGPANFIDYRDISGHATELNEYKFGPASVLLYLANGVTIDYDHGVHGTMSWTPEIGSATDGFWPPQQRIVPLAEDNLEAFLRTALAAGSYPYLTGVTPTDMGDADGYFESGETFEFVASLRNGGLEDTTGNVSITLESSSPFVTIGDAVATVGALSSFTAADNQGSPLSLSLAGAIPDGTKIEYSVRIDWDGLSQVVTKEFTTGREVTLISDDVESKLGWVTGLPGDTASTGVWQRGNPKQTIAASNVFASPEDDATPGSGVRCYITGNLSNLISIDDVDDGFTTLVSPRIDLSGLTYARMSYARWFGDLNIADDVLEVSISDNDGVNWVTLESVDEPTYEWTEFEFLVQDYVALTDSIRLRFVLGDDPDNSIAEACIDELRVEVYNADPLLNIFGQPTIGENIAFHVTSPDGGAYGIFESSGTGLFNFGLVNGPLLLDPLTMGLILQSNVPVEGVDRQVLSIPLAPTLVGQTLYYQALVSAPAGLFLTNRKDILFE